VDTVEKPALKPTQEKFLAGMLEGRPFSDLCRELDMTKQNGALLITQLRQLGLVLTRPGRKHRRVTIPSGKAGAIIWWDAKQEDALDPRKPGPERWWVYTTAIPRYERADVKPLQWVVVVTAPWGQFTFTASDRERLSYRHVHKVLTRALLDHFPTKSIPRDWDGTVRTVTEMVADAMGVQAVLPVEFTQVTDITEVEDHGGQQDDGDDGDHGFGFGADDDAATGG
jgi:hypothetical protein